MTEDEKIMQDISDKLDKLSVGLSAARKELDDLEMDIRFLAVELDYQAEL